MTATPAPPLTRPTTAQRRGVLTVTAITAGAFGPYLVGGLRTEQLAVYGAAAVLLPLTWTRLRPSPALAVVLAAWGLLVAVAGLGWIWPPLNLTAYADGDPLANLDNLLLGPTAALVVLALLARGADVDRLLHRTAAVVVAAMCVNSVVALAQIRWPLDATLVRWWSAGDDPVAARALTLGRYTGVVNQPSLAGVLYGVALLGALYLLHDRARWLAVVCVVLVVGGALAVSKAFFLVGLPVAVWHLAAMGGRRQRRWVTFGAAGAGLYAAAAFELMPSWVGMERLAALVPTADVALLDLYTGNRYGAASSLRAVTETVLDGEPLAGFGMPGLATATDSAWVAALVVAGLLGVAAVAVVLAGVIVGVRHRRHGMPEPVRRLAGGLVVLVVAASFGTPLLTGNRAAVVVWVLLALLLSWPRDVRAKA